LNYIELRCAKEVKNIRAVGLLIHCIRPMHRLEHRLRSILLNIILTVHKADEVC